VTRLLKSQAYPSIVELKELILSINCENQIILDLKSELLENLEDKKKIKELIGLVRDYIREEPQIPRKKIQELERFCMQAAHLMA